MTWVTKDKSGNIIGKDRKKPKVAKGTIIERVNKNYDEVELHLPYGDKRRKEYPDIGEQLDALWKCINQMRLDGANIPQEADNILGKILAVKNKYPKK